MADKQLDEAAWRNFSGKHDVQDTSLAKALAQLARAEKQGPEEVLEALVSVDKQVALLIKAHKAHALVTRQLEAIDAASRERRKTVARQLEAAESTQAEDEADSPALLSTKMIPLLRELRKGEARMAAMVCTAGRETAVLIMRRAISPARRKLLAEAVDAKGGAKYLSGDCAYEGGVLTFVLPNASAGLAKRLREALLRQVQLRLKVQVRSDDGALDRDGEDEGEDGQEEGEQQRPAIKETAGMKTEPADPVNQQRYLHRLGELAPRLDRALKAGHADATRLRALHGFASEKAQGGDTSAALKALDMLEKLLLTQAPSASASAPATAPAAASAADGAAELAAEFKARLSTLLPRLKAAQAAEHPAAPEFRRQLAEAGELAKGLRFDAALQLLSQAEQGLAQTAPAGVAKALANWGRIRAETIADLKDMAKKIAAARHEKSAMALIEVNAVIKNLTAEPDTVQKVAELERWLQDDDVVADVTAMVRDIRGPLLGALSDIRAAIH